MKKKEKERISAWMAQLVAHQLDTSEVESLNPGKGENYNSEPCEKHISNNVGSWQQKLVKIYNMIETGALLKMTKSRTSKLFIKWIEMSRRLLKIFCLVRCGPNCWLLWCTLFNENETKPDSKPTKVNHICFTFVSECWIVIN